MHFEYVHSTSIHVNNNKAIKLFKYLSSTNVLRYYGYHPESNYISCCTIRNTDSKATEGDYLSDEGSVSRISADQNVQSSTSRLMLVTPLFHGHTIHHCVEVHDFDDSALFAQTRANPLLGQILILLHGGCGST